MASFAAQLKDKFLGVIYRVTGWSSGGAGVGKDTILPEEPTKFAIVQPVEVRSRGGQQEPDVDNGDLGGAN
ncbi:hypothetical protein BDA96_06G257300 [Sorghum bicolor]|uniref:Uncharacterized protein n=2 Tax=Sorghum bicolor TaxID=4558 RepID=A0A921QU45_SORBI|nr:hypothetical protein BDA96_06G257300 [Sorghum bicolor]KXG27233.1 hypothetical protein SORBI_3006G235000 [Sorghum bicolor]